MQYEGREESENVEDLRGSGGGGGRIMMGGGLGTLVLVVIVALLGGDPRQFLNQMPKPVPQQGGPQGAPQGPDKYADTVKLIKVVLKDTEDVWHAEFPKLRKGPYRDPKLVLFTENVQSGCGLASANMGPFYCPADQKVYLDVRFFDALRDRFKAPGDFAVAYVVAHEVGHHVQNLTGRSSFVHGKKGRVSADEYNQWSVRLELQADFLAGVWAKNADRMKKILEEGDLVEAIGAAQAVGDDRLQKQARGHASPETFTHGTSAQRVRWFKRGYETGDVTLLDDLFELDYGKL